MSPPLKRLRKGKSSDIGGFGASASAETAAGVQATFTSRGFGAALVVANGTMDGAMRLEKEKELKRDVSYGRF
jgi:hypothetical protein